MKSFLFFALCLFLLSCNKTETCGPDSHSKEIKQTVGTKEACTPTPDPEQPDPDPNPTPTPDPEGDVPEGASHFDAAIKFDNFDMDQEEKVHKAIEIIKKVIATREFRAKVLTYSYNGKNQFVDNGGLTNEQIYLKLLEGAEKLFPEEDYEMDLELELYYSSKNTVGYTYPDTVKIFMNTKYFNPYTPSQVAGNIFHEWTHKLGFEHAVSYSIARDSSVPYALGYLIRDLGKQFE